MSKYDIDKSFVSPIDRFLFEFDAKHEKSASQLLEIKKHQRIFALRDKATLQVEQSEIWQEF